VEREFVPVSMLVRLGYVLVVVHPSVPAPSVAELIALAKARPGCLAFSSSGNGAGSHLAGELPRIGAGIDIAHVPYRGTGRSVQDVVAGQVPMTIDSLSVLIPPIRGGALNALGVTHGQRVAELPEVPAVPETLPGFEMIVINHLAVRSDTPQPIIERLSRAVVKAMASPAAERRYADTGSLQGGSTPGALGWLQVEERDKWRALVTRAGTQAGKGGKSP